MAITKVSQYNSSPTTVADYQAQNNYLQALINQANGSVGILTQADVSTIPSISQGSYISMGGTLYIVDTEDYTILGSVISGNNYIAIAVSGVNLIATWVQDISSYSWNNVYNYYSNGTNILLPYIISYDTSYYIGTFQQSFKANQSLLTTSDVEFNDINANSVTTTGGIATSGAILPTIAPITGVQTILKNNGTWTPSRGIYMGYFESSNNILLSIDAGTTYSSVYLYAGNVALFADGTNIVLKNNDSNDHNFNYLKF